MKVYVEGTDDQVDEKERSFFQILQEGDEVLKKISNRKQHFTQPPPRYTEARLSENT